MLAFAGTLLTLAVAHLLRIRSQSLRSLAEARQIRALECELSGLRSFVRRLTLLSTQSTVIHVTDDLWRDAVKAAARSTDVALGDVSTPSDNVRWEIEQLRSLSMPRIFIAEQSHLRRWQDAEDGDAQTSFSLIDGPILTYDAGHRLGGEDFRRRLPDMVRRSTATVRERPPLRWLDRSLLLLREIVFYAVVIGPGLALSYSIAGWAMFTMAFSWEGALLAPDLWIMTYWACAAALCSGLLAPVLPVLFNWTPSLESPG